MARIRIGPRAVATAALCLLAVGAGQARAAGDLKDLGSVKLAGEVYESEDISAVAVVGNRLLIASDEGAALQWLLPGEDPVDYRASRRGLLLLEGDLEADLEALAAQGNRIYAVGSHSRKRAKLRSGTTQYDNRKRLPLVVYTPARDHLFRFSLDAAGEPVLPVESISLRHLVAEDEILGRFSGIPGKENGLDIEGLAASEDRLYLGLRSPVLRGGLVPVIVLRFDRPRAYRLSFVDLGGRGIRSLARVDDGFLIVAGSEYGKADCSLFFWSGEDLLPGRDAPRGALRRLGGVPAPQGGVPEALAILEETPQAWRAIVFYDGPPGGAPRRFLVRK